MVYNKTMKDNFKHQSALDPKGLARYLSALAEGAERGSLPLSDGEHNFAINPRGFIDLSLKIRRKNGRIRLNLDLSWAEKEIDLPLLNKNRNK